MYKAKHRRRCGDEIKQNQKRLPIIDIYEVLLRIIRMWIKRDITNLIQKLCTERPSLLLTGARQTGKSSLLSRIFPEHACISLDVPLAKNKQLTGQYIMTGSQKFSLMKGVPESLAGKISILNLYSLSTRELANHFNAELNTRQILEWIVKGGYPEIYEHNLDHNRFYANLLILMQISGPRTIPISRVFLTY